MNEPQILGPLAVLSSQLRLQELIPTVLDVSLELTGADRSFLMLYDRANVLSVKAARNRRKKDLKEADFEGSTTIIHRVLQEQKALFLPRLAQSPEIASSKSVQKWNLQSALCIPLRRYRPNQDNAEMLGVLYLDSSSHVYPLSEAHLPLMEALANHAAIAIEHAEMFEELQLKNREIESLNRRLEQRLEIQAGSITEMKMLLADTQRELGRSYGIGHIIGKSKAMREVFRILEKVARTQAIVLITGESGTGKELIARHIHFSGPRSEKPMVSINCSAFNDTLLESELFGHRKGAFTGAFESKTGLFQMADGGTLFLDEVGDMSAEMQRKLLRVIEDGQIRPLGSNETQVVDVRVLAATHRNLKAMVRDGLFREDLYFRLNVISIPLPPLRARPEDIPLLVEFYRRKLSEELRQPPMKISDHVMKRFLEHRWPGNVRELVNELRRYFILGSEYRMDQMDNSPSGDEGDLASLEKRAILEALKAAGGNKTRAAGILKIPRTSFYDKLSKYGLDAEKTRTIVKPRNRDQG